MPVWDEQHFREAEAEWVERFQALEAEIERLKVEVATLEELTVRTAENEQLRVQEEMLLHDLAIRSNEYERLRAALEQIANVADPAAALWAVNIAREALAKPKRA